VYPTVKPDLSFTAGKSESATILNQNWNSMNEKDIIERFKAAQDSLVIQQSDFSLAAIFDMVDRDSIDISPGYQRRDRWNIEKQSALIESFLLNVPVPPVYLSEDEYGSYSVIDGKQRITAVCDFLAGNLRLKQLKKFPELDGFLFSELPVQLQNALTVRPYIRVTTLLKQSNQQLKYEVFLRLNTGGDTLKPQEIRNVAYSGPLNDLLLELSEDSYLRERMKITGEKSPAFRAMDDVEHVLRFFTIHSSWKSMRNVLSEEMDRFMENNREANTAAERQLFEKAIRACQKVFGDHAFHKPTPSGWREQFISPLYDAQMVAMALLPPSYIKILGNRKDAVNEAIRERFEEDTEFVKSVSQSTNNSASVRRRVQTMIDTLKEVAEL
jgi:hypothetical protein